LFTRFRQMLQQIRRILSRNVWAVRLLNLPSMGDGRGIVLIQIDGLSYTQFEKALDNRQLPFLRKQIQQGRHGVKPMYSGVPSATPAFQGELFYGVKSCVPAFEFIVRDENQRHISFYPQSASYLARGLEKKGTPLLSGGHAYSTIFSGGAKEARYCSQKMGLESIARSVNPLKLVLLVFMHAGKFLRILTVTLIEFILAVTDFFRGIAAGRKFVKELVFIPARIAICVILRELIRFRVKMDVTRGVPIICANFLGYDEQAHRRGPGSRFAHWSLKGIDDAIKDIYRTANRSRNREYHLIIYSDHGQEAVTWYGTRFGMEVKDVIRHAYCDHQTDTQKKCHEASDNVLAGLYKKSREFFLNKRFPEKLQSEIPVSLDNVQITTMGPLGHVYLPPIATLEKIRAFADTLVRTVHIPLVIFQEHGRIIAVNVHGSFDLEHECETVLGKDHPFAAQTARDLAGVCRHRNAGDIVISGWDPNGPPLSFNIESGAHGGPGREETRGVVILPKFMETEKSFMRALDLRHLVMEYMDISGKQ